jgi:hypothetical protein
MEPALIVRDVCAWPVVTRTSGNAIGIVYFNRPSHGLMEGGLDAITSRNEGQTWEPAPSPAPPPSGENRMHIASGVDHTGAWIVL